MKTNEEIFNVIVTENNTKVVKSALLKGSYSGTGDIFSSVVCGGVVNGMDVFDAVSLATEFIYFSIKNTPTDLDYEPLTSLSEAAGKLFIISLYFSPFNVIEGTCTLNYWNDQNEDLYMK